MAVVMVNKVACGRILTVPEIWGDHHALWLLSTSQPKEMLLLMFYPCAMTTSKLHVVPKFIRSASYCAACCGIIRLLKLHSGWLAQNNASSRGKTQIQESCTCAKTCVARKLDHSADCIPPPSFSVHHGSILLTV